MNTQGATLGSLQETITIPAGVTLSNYFMFPPNTMLVATFYINNQSSIPSGSTGTVNISIVDWLSGHNSVLILNDYIYGKYIENYPATNLSFTNTFNMDIIIYIQYSIKVYSEYSNPVIQDLTELLLIPQITLNSLTATTNFRYYGSLADFDTTNLSVGNTFYVLDQQAYGTSSTAAGSVTVPYVATYTENINVSALGAAEDSNIYFFTTDSTTLKLPSSSTSTNALMNWIKIDFYSPLLITYTAATLPIIYNSATNNFDVASTSLTIQSVAENIQNVGAPFCVYVIS